MCLSLLLNFNHDVTLESTIESFVTRGTILKSYMLARA